MKKSYLLMAVAAALMLTACSSENDVVQSAAQLQQSAPKAVGFDVYTPSSTTRAGLTGTMTTNRLQLTEGEGGGFGVYAFLTEDDVPAAFNPADGTGATSYESANPASATNVPTFMVNEKLLWNNTNLGWYYNPLKYWPNETDNDSQTTSATMENSTTPKHLDRLTFFAYAPYVTETAADGSGTGIVYITDKAGKLNSANTADPTIAWKANTSDVDVNPDEGVDVLWGVAPAGGLSYTAVNGTTVTVDEGKPLINMVKPDVNTSMKFLFNHALARFGFTVVAAVDQVSPGGKLDPNTKINIEKLKITGPFGSYGNLNLNNGTHANVANWTSIKGTDITSTSTNTGATDAVLILLGNNKADGSDVDPTPEDNAIAEHLRWTRPHDIPVAQTVVGVTTAKQDLLRPSTKWFNKLASTPVYNPGKQYYKTAASTTPVDAATYTTVAADQYYTESGGVYTRVTDGTSLTAPNYPAAYTATAYYTLREIAVYNSDDFTAAPVAGADYYTKTGETYEKVTPTWGSGTTQYYLVEGQKVLASEIPFAYAAGDFYEAERNYVYVVPTNNLLAQNSSITPGSADDLALRTIEVQIEYYITTEDSKLSSGFAQTKNVITKKVVLPSLANGKTYNLNMVLGLTSVKIEAEVDDWKVINSQVDLPQNTAE